MVKANFSYKPVHYILAFVVLEAFLVIFYPFNRTEVDDGYWYAQGVRDEDFADLFNPRFMVFLPLMKIIYQFVNDVLFRVDAYSLMSMVSMIFSGLTILLLFDTFKNRLKLSFHTSLFGTLLLLFSYEYWRYSYEAEVYLISIFLILLSYRIFLSTLKKFSFGKLIAISILGVIAALIYKLNVIPVFLAFPLMYLLKRRIQDVLILYAAGGFLFFSSTFLIHLIFVPADSYLSFLFGGINEPQGKPYMSFFVVASNFVSVLWLFGNDALVTIISKSFPHKIIDEEIFTAKQITALEPFFWVLFFALLTLVVVLCMRVYSKRPNLGLFQKHAYRTSLVWLSLYSIFLLIMDPSSNEPWLMIQMPLVIFITLTVSKAIEGKGVNIAYILLAILFLLNSAGGIGLLKNKEFDYNRKKSQWLLENAEAGDVIISYGPISFIRYLSFYSEATVISIEESPKLSYEKMQMGNGKGKVFITGDVVKSPDAFKYRSEDIVRNIEELLNDLKITLKSKEGYPIYQIIY